MLSDENDSSYYLIASNQGYGFIIKFKDLVSTFKNGKSVISLKQNYELLEPDAINNIEKDMGLAVTNKGKILIFPLKQLPYLKKGQGNKIISIPQKRGQGKNRQHDSEFEADSGFGPEPEQLKFFKALPQQASIAIYSGKHVLKLSSGNWKDYCGIRGQRGKRLPEPFTVVDQVEISGNAG